MSNGHNTDYRQREKCMGTCNACQHSADTADHANRGTQINPTPTKLPETKPLKRVLSPVAYIARQP